jgi:hypothetical protein
MKYMGKYGYHGIYPPLTIVKLVFYLLSIPYLNNMGMDLGMGNGYIGLVPGETLGP